MQRVTKKGGTVSSIAIGVDYFQVLSIFVRSKIKWPEQIKELLRLFSVFNLNM